MHQDNSPFIVLMADDDEDDRLLAHEALLESKANYEIKFVKDGIELMEYLCRRGTYQNNPDVSMPDLILLDLNMPRKDGREVLAELKSNPLFSPIPVVILTTSNTLEDIQYSRKWGAISYQTKPVTFNAMVDLMKALLTYCSNPKANSN